MSDQNDLRPSAAQALARDAAEDELSSGLYPSRGRSRSLPGAPGARDQKPTHYKVICISMYTEDLQRLDGMVDELKARGLTKANRSALIRYALDGVDVESVPKGF